MPGSSSTINVVVGTRVMPTACWPRSSSRPPVMRSIRSSSARPNGSSRRWQTIRQLNECELTNIQLVRLEPFIHRSFHLFDVRHLPTSVENRLFRTIESKPGEPTRPRRRENPVRLLTGGRLRSDVDVHRAVGV